LIKYLNNYMPGVTILTAVKNGEKYLAETVESIRQQSFDDWEYILVDDNSSDSTINIIEQFQSKDKRIHLIKLKESLGPYGAANVGLKKATGHYIIRTDADDISLPNRITRQLKFLKDNPKLRACASYAQRIDENSHVMENNFVKSSLSSGSMKWFLFLRCPLVHSTACVERQVFEEMGGYDTSFAAQDYRMWSYLVRRGYVAQIPEVLVYFRLTPSGISLSQRGIQSEKGLKVAQDHILKVTGEDWSLETVEALNAFGLVKKGSPVSAVIKASRLWDKYWMADTTLAAEEINELAAISTYLRKTFLRRNRRKQFLPVIKNAFEYIFPAPRLKQSVQLPRVLPY